MASYIKINSHSSNSQNTSSKNFNSDHSLFLLIKKKLQYYPSRTMIIMRMNRLIAKMILTCDYSNAMCIITLVVLQTALCSTTWENSFLLAFVVKQWTSFIVNPMACKISSLEKWFQVQKSTINSVCMPDLTTVHS